MKEIWLLVREGSIKWVAKLAVEATPATEEAILGAVKVAFHPPEAMPV
jgi:hypothetical protein